MTSDNARLLASAVAVASAPAFVILVAVSAPFAVCLVPIGIGIFAGFVASTQDA
jgi:hypothetical protein